MDSIKHEILSASYWEHFKFAKELSLILPIEHPKRRLVNKNLNEISESIKSGKMHSDRIHVS